MNNISISKIFGYGILILMAVSAISISIWLCVDASVILFSPMLAAILASIASAIAAIMTIAAMVEIVKE